MDDQGQHESQKITELDDDNKFTTIRNSLTSSTVLAINNGEDVATGSDCFSNSNINNEESNILNSNSIKTDDPSMLKLNIQATEEFNSQSIENDNPTPSSNEPVTSVIIYICHLCHTPCHTLESVIVHGKGVNCSSLHKLSNKECPLFKCELCQCKYKSLNLLTVHLKRHTVRKFRCTLCANTYVSKIELDFHQRSHRNERPHKCELCPSSFRYVHHLKRHKDIIHFGKRHMCPEPNCNRQFTTLDQLKIHKWSHYGIVPYKCKYCERLFKKRFLLRDHCLKAHNIRLTEDEVADIFRLSLGYTSPHDLTLAVRNGNMLMPDIWESLPPSLQ